MVDGALALLLGGAGERCLASDDAGDGAVSWRASLQAQLLDAPTCHLVQLSAFGPVFCNASAALPGRNRMPAD